MRSVTGPTSRSMQTLTLGSAASPCIKAGAARSPASAPVAQKRVKIPVIGLGDPRSPLRVAQELGRFLREEGVGNAREIVGTLKWPVR